MLLLSVPQPKLPQNQSQRCPANLSAEVCRPVKRYIVWIMMLGLLAGCAWLPLAPKEFGVLQGHVTIGPLSPVEQAGQPSPTPAPEVYAARQIVVYKADGKTEAARVRIDPHGDFSVELPQGEYVIDINRAGVDSAKGLPVKITIYPNQVVVLDIDIDTGIR